MRKKFKFIHKTGKVFKDERGYLLKILDKGFSSCIEIFSKKGSIRANHYHKKDEHFCYILKGEILFFYRNRKKGSKLNYKIMKKGDLFFTTYDQAHLALEVDLECHFHGVVGVVLEDYHLAWH